MHRPASKHSPAPRLRRFLTLTTGLTIALVVAVSYLGYVVHRDFVVRDDVELSERSRATRETRLRFKPGVVEEPADARVRMAPIAPRENLAATVAPATGEVDPRDEAPLGGERRATVVTAGGTAAEQSGGAGASQWYSADVIPVLATQLLHFALAFELPEGEPARDQRFTIGILGDHALALRIAEILREARVWDAPLIVLSSEEPWALWKSQIMFVGDLSRSDDARVKFASRPIMTVTYTGAKLDDTWCDIELIWIDRQMGYVIDREGLGRKRITVRDSLFGFEQAYVRGADGRPVAPSRG